VSGRHARIRSAAVLTVVAAIVLFAQLVSRRGTRELVPPAYLGEPSGSLARSDVDGFSAVLAQLGDTPFAPIPDDVAREALGRFLAAIERIGPRTRPELFLTLKDRIAYLVNAHMAWALALHDGGGLVPEGLTDIRTVRLRLDGATWSLAAIESQIIELASTEPRLVLFLNPGFANGPPLARTALEGYALDFQISEQAGRCGRAPGFWSLDPAAHRLGVSAVAEYFPGLPEDRRERARRLLALVPPPQELRQRIDASCGLALESCTVFPIPFAEGGAKDIRGTGQAPQ
jgi:hypothetical protein